MKFNTTNHCFKTVRLLGVEVTAEDIQALREWIAKMPNVPSHYDDKYLASFIIGCKGSLQKTKLVLENFSSVGTKYPDMYGNLDMFNPRLVDFLDAGIVYPLEKKIDDDVSVFFYAISKKNSDPYKFDIPQYFAYDLASMIVRLKENSLGSGKVMMVIDGSEVTLTHMRSMTPALVKSWLYVLDNLVPMRLNGIHTFGMPAFMEWVFNLIKTLIKAKIAQRIHLHRTIEDVYKYVPREILPKDYGGEGEESQTGHDQWRRKMESYNDMLLKEQAILKDLDKLRIKTKDEEMMGTFKKLAVD